MKQLIERKGKEFPVKLRLTPGLFDHSGTWASGIKEAMELGYMEMNAKLLDGDTIYLYAFVEYGYRGDEDGYGVEPDEYLAGTVAPDGTFVTPLHIS